MDLFLLKYIFLGRLQWRAPDLRPWLKLAWPDPWRPCLRYERTWKERQCLGSTFSPSPETSLIPSSVLLRRIRTLSHFHSWVYNLEAEWSSKSVIFLKKTK